MKKEIAILSAGCFWHIEEIFSKTEGVIKTRVGYTSGSVKNPTYDQVSLGKTGHTEAIKITFDPEKISYKQILKIFWKMHDPTLINKQGADIGTNYHSGIFYLNEKQKKEAKQSRDKTQKELGKPIVTEITKASEFFPAEGYHQKYFEKNEVFLARDNIEK